VLLPLVVLAGGRCRWSVRVGWSLLALCIVSAIGWRSLQWTRFGDADHGKASMQHIYYSSWCRLDELLPRVAVVMVKHFHTPGQAKVREIDTPDRFIDFIVSSPEHLEETVQRLQVVTDTEVATVSFDSEFWSNSKMQNPGFECWQLVHSETGWKVAFIVYSIE
jgi:hypothetical protein